MANIVIPKNTFVNLLDTASIPVGTVTEIVCLNSNIVQIYNTASTPTVGTDSYLPCVWPFKVLTQSGDLGVWAFSSVGGAVDIREVS